MSGPSLGWFLSWPGRPGRGRHRAPRRPLARTALALTLLVGGLVGVPGATPAQAAAGLTVTGHGFGHGRGMGQWGALGYAVQSNWTAGQILGHYYGGTSAGTVPASTMTVRLTNRDGAETIVLQQKGNLATSVGGIRGVPAVRIALVAPGRFALFTGPGCAGPWTEVGSGWSAPSVTVSPTAPSDNPADLLANCEAGGVRWVRGDLRAVDDNGTQRTVNALDVDSYLRGVVPRESPASWGDLGSVRPDTGAPQGLEALKAQAVAARSYALAENRWPYAKTCDTTACQVYAGRAYQPTGGSLTSLEDPRSDRAIAATAGQVRLLGGAVARTEFSASTGGYTAGGTFPAVPDAGDAYPANPWNSWTRTIDAGTVEAAFGARDLRNVVVLSRNGLGADGGRVLQVRFDFAGASFTKTGAQVRAMLGLPSDWFTPVLAQPGDTKTQPAGGYVLDADGGLTPFGAAPAVPRPAGLAAGTARAVALGGPDPRAGYVLAADGRLFPVGGAPAVVPTGLWPGQDVARDVALRPDGRSGYVLDLFGGLQPFGGAPVPSGGRYDTASDWARRIVLRPDGSSGWVVGADGAAYAFGGAPAAGPVTMPANRAVVGAWLGVDGASVVVADSAGSLHRSGAPDLPAQLGSPVAAAAGRADATSGYAVVGGRPGPFGGASPAAAGAPTGARVVGLALVSEPRGYTLDLFGGLHPFGGAPPTQGGPYWLGQDVARKVVVGPSGAGYVMDAYGGLHPFGTPAAAAPPVPQGLPYWPGWAIARDVVLLPGSDRAGYLLDGWGGIHPFGGAPPVRGSIWWQGWDIARGLALNPDGRGGYVLDGWGGLHAFAVGDNPIPPEPSLTAYWTGWDIARGLVVTGSGRGFVLDGWGSLHGFGGQTGAGSWWWGGRDNAVGLAGVGGTSGWVVYTDRAGYLHTGPESAPAAMTGDLWPGQDIVRDVAVVPRP